MSYYNPYLNYPYTNTGINQFNSPMQATAPQMPMSTQPMMQPSAPPQTLGLNGKIVWSGVHLRMGIKKGVPLYSNLLLTLNLIL